MNMYRTFLILSEIPPFNVSTVELS